MTESDKAVMQQALNALPDMTELSSSMDERAVYGYTAEQMQAYARAAIAQPVHESIASTAIECVAQPEQPNNLEAAVFDAWEHYAGMGSVCRFEGRSMIYASTLEEIYEAAIAQPVEPLETTDTERLDWLGIYGSFGADSISGQPGGNGQMCMAATRKNIDAAMAKTESTE